MQSFLSRLKKVDPNFTGKADEKKAPKPEVKIPRYSRELDNPDDGAMTRARNWEK